MSRRARIYIGIILATGISLALVMLLGLSRSTQWPTLLGLLVAVVFSRMFAVEEADSPSFSAMPIVVFAGVLLLDPALFVLLTVLPCALEWFHERRQRQRWLLRPFHGAVQLIAGLVAHGVFLALGGDEAIIGTLASFPPFMFAGVAYVMLKEAARVGLLVVTGALPWRQALALDMEALLPDVAMVCLGALAAALWRFAPWLIVPAMIPLGLVYRVLVTSRLMQQARIDPQTNLAEPRYFHEVFATELERANRFNRPLAVLVADLDFLRVVNATWGHATGDRLVAEVGKEIRRALRQYDTACHTTNNEFVILLPETTQSDAHDVAQRLRRLIELASFVVPNRITPITTTISLGIACFPGDGTTPAVLVEAARAAVRQAKQLGRNRVVQAADQTDNKIAGATGAVEDTPNRARSAIPEMAAVEVPGLSVPPNGETSAPERSRPSAMPASAWFFIYLSLLLGTVWSSVAMLGFTPSSLQQPIFLVLLALTTVAQIYKADGPNHELFHPAPVFLFAGVLLLSPSLFIVLVIVSHLLEWGWERWRRSPHLRHWYLQPFNMAMYSLAGLVAQWVLSLFGITPGAQLPISVISVGATVLAYVLTNQLMLGTVLLLARGISWRDSRVLSSGLLTEAVLASLGFAAALQWQHSPWLMGLALAPLALIYQSLSIPKLQAESMRTLQQVNTELSSANRAIHKLNDELFQTLAKIFDARDPYVGGHAAQVATYAVAIAEELGLSTGEIEQIRQAAYLHDIGKMAIPESILHKPGKLTDEEFEIIKTHAALGAEFLETSKGLRHLSPFVRHHHERWDGRGYPDGLSGTKIPLEARILNVCDSVEAMASDRPYHKGMSVEAIIAEVQRCAGTQFDPRIAEIFVRIAAREREAFVVNSARAVIEQQAGPNRLPSYNSGMIFAQVYHQATS